MAAIYTWYDDGIVYLTTTLYPVEVLEAMELNISITVGSMYLVPTDEIAFINDMDSTIYTQVRWFYEDGPYADEIAFINDMDSTSYVQTRWFYEDGPYTDEIGFTDDMFEIIVLLKGVLADTPDEELQLSIAIDATCSMDLI